MQEKSDEGEFKIADDLWLLKSYLEEAKEIKGRFLIIVKCGEDFCSFDFEFDEKTKIKISDNFIFLTDEKYSHLLINIKEIIYLRKYEDTDQNL